MMRPCWYLENTNRMLLFDVIRRGSMAAIFALLAGAGASAAPLNVLNFSFETPVQSAGGFNNFIPDWTMSGFGGVFRPNVGVQVFSVPDGSQVAFLGFPASIFQDLGVPVSIGETYQLDVLVGTEVNFRGGSYTVELLAGATTLASFTGANNQTDPFIPISISGVGTGSGNIGVRLTSNGGQPLFDNVRVQAGSSVPEPATWTALPLGFALFSILKVWRRRVR